MRGICVLAIVAGCGRIDFDPETLDASSDALASSDAVASCATSGDWVLIQVNGNSNDNGVPTLPLAITATSGGDMMIVAVQGQAPGVATVVADGAGSLYTRLDGTAGTDAVAGNTVEIWYSSAVGGGANDVDVTFSTLSYAIVAWEFQTPKPAVVDTVAQLSNEAASTTPVSPTITTRCANEIVVAALISGAVNGSATGNEFNNDSGANFNGWAHLTDPHAPAGLHTAAWTSGNTSYCSSAAAFIVE